ncbi:helix-turn-helix transcriptional regulator [Sphingobacterium oryzagri]|uniref:Helix-turn-helix transcriptional regulator n=1 Tax=Sphingobacterium oryzagri TaxID=3025669 RepID=A0ABY7WBV6_9SPHI|nr:helix-turn-helix transcriptional regulator [Sphingobacterium sp. KACC 22765]WDF66935.1 helix-turn-helix transcriptional regulator [Sphingobacterium sp. KACC 22765]
MEQDHIDFRKRLGERIAELRVSRGMEQGELAAFINKDKQFINRYERQGANPTAFILVQIANALEVSPNDLLNFKLSK